MMNIMLPDSINKMSYFKRNSEFTNEKREVKKSYLPNRIEQK